MTSAKIYNSIELFRLVFLLYHQCCLKNIQKNWSNLLHISPSCVCDNVCCVLSEPLKLVISCCSSVQIVGKDRLTRVRAQ